MIDYIDYEDGETGLLLSVCYKKNDYGDTSILSVLLDDNDIITLISDEVMLAIQLYIEDSIDFTELD